ncbi:MAG TPA: response regulator [Candidatus Dormibacteraeota bacterium]|nr:response regulator [Candidatus Dormibacteraeota bacterium]
MSASSLILLVEDNEANQMLARAVLELDGYEVRVAGSGPEVFETLQAWTPDLILMDIQLPGQDGLSVTRSLKADPATASIPVVALTAHAMSGDRQLAINAGCAGYISKPIDTRTFGAQVRQFLPSSVDDDRRVAAQ